MVAIARIEVRNGQVVHATGLSGQPLEAHAIDLSGSFDPRAGGLHLDGTAVVNGVPASFVLGLRTTASADAPVDLKLGVPGGRLAFAGWPGERTTDGRSLVPLLQGGDAGAPAGWRAGGLLVEHLGEVNQWMQVCGTIWNASCPGVAADPFYLIDGPQNTWSMLRVVNATHDLSYVEFRPQQAPLARASSNWTEAYDLAADPFQSTNVAASLPGRADLADRLWEVADCAGDACP